MNRLNKEASPDSMMKVSTFQHTFASPEERKEIIEVLKIGTDFDMRPRALFHFYGKDLIAFKRKHPSSPQVNEFLRIFS